MTKSVLWVICAATAAMPLLGQDQGPTTAELQKQTQNPVSSLISIPFQNNVNFPVGQYSRVQDVLNIQPVVPIRVSEDWNVITRWIAPVIYQPDVRAGDG